MTDIRNEFYLSLDDNKKENFDILFDNFIDSIVQFKGFIEEKKDKRYEITLSNRIDNTSNNTNFNDKLNEFIKLQKDNNEIDLSFIKFTDKYDFTDESSLLNKILVQHNICEYNQDKKCSKIKKRISFANAIFKKQVEFIRVDFNKQVSFEGTIFLDNANFQGATFEKDIEDIEEKLQGTIFEGAKFKKEAIFNEAIFKDMAKFFRTKFYDYTSFNKTKFYSDVSFENAISKDLFYFHDVSIGNLNLIGFHYEKANFLILTNIDETNPTLTKDNFENKDTARIIKAHFEKQNNITETNDYFIIEQEFYIDLLSKDNTSYSNKTINIISLLFNKYISNYGTDWVRVLIVIFGFGFLASFGYGFFEETCTYFSSHKNWFIGGFIFSFILYIFYLFKYIKLFLLTLIIYICAFTFIPYIRELTNSISTLINPLNIFKLNKEYFKDIVIYGVFVKGVVATLIYQFIISFRNSTRRK